MLATTKCMMQSAVGGLKEMTKIQFLGLANAGKSTILNLLLKKPVCSTSKLAQTTRAQMRYIDPARSICYIDSPGLVKRNVNVESEIKKTPWKIHADILFLVVDATQKTLDSAIFDDLKKVDIPVYGIYNKMDLVERNSKLVSFPVPVVKSFKVCAIQGDIDPLVDELDAVSKPVHNNNALQFYSNQDVAEEVIREQLYQNVYSYIPYITKQRTIGFSEENGHLFMLLNYFMHNKQMCNFSYVYSNIQSELAE
eukprot:NODE_97_length_21155_cov_0.234850.p8 type:complete len:253 gc:universal NODE_97_length_21155_cov_0.234850:16128-15370(-)